MRAIMGTSFLVAIVAAYAPGSAQTAQAASATEARVTLHDPSGAEAGWARLQQSGNDVVMRIEAKSLSPGMHGVHIHTVGKCEAPDFASAGGHWNPAGRQHGKYNPAGAHMGDAPNLIVDGAGKGTLLTTLKGASLAALRDADGSAIVIHAVADDYLTDPSGNSGARIVCGVIGS
jgi:Cu-Zn family superoxide dismutase